MRKGILFVLVFGLLLGICFAQGNVVEKKWAVVLRDANVRSMPSTQGSILFIAKAGERLEVLEDMGVWLKVKRADGTVGYIWAKLVRIEVERVVKQAPPPSPTPAPKPSPQPAPKPSPRRTPSHFRPFGFSFNLDYAFVSPEDFNAVTQYLNLLFDAFTNYGLTLDQPLGELKSSMGGGVEFTFRPHPNIGLGLGFSYAVGKKGGESTLSAPSSYIKYTQDLSSTIYGPYFSLHFMVPAQMITLDLFAKAGYYKGSFSLKYDGSDSSGNTSYAYFEDISKGTLGFGGGLRVKFSLSGNAGVFLGGSYNFLKFKDLEGTYRGSSTGTVKGKLYYLEGQSSLGPVHNLRISPTPPSGNFTARPAEFNFSGFTVGAGFFMEF